MSKKYTIKSLKEMDGFAAEFSKTLKGGEVLALTGDLGAGKTAFTKGLAKALGIKQVVQSPTFLLMKCYPVGKNQEPRTNFQKLCHVDAYRVKKESELVTIGLEEYLHDPGTVTVIEWADLVKGLIPKHAIRMRFEHGKDDNQRIVTVTRKS